MAFRYVSIEEAQSHAGLRMVVVGGIPSPWSEAAKGILHIKGLDWAAVRLAYDSDMLKQWNPLRNAPVALHADEKPRTGWADILFLAERLAPTPALLPHDPLERALALGLSHEICGEQGLGWMRRLQLVHAGLHGTGGFPAKVAQYLARKYGYHPEDAGAQDERVEHLLRMLATRLEGQQVAGSPYYIGNSVTAVDVYSATFMALFRPLPQEHCAMDPVTRAAFETRDARTDAALAPILLAHRDMMYAKHLVLPLSL